MFPLEKFKNYRNVTCNTVVNIVVMAARITKHQTALQFYFVKVKRCRHLRSITHKNIPLLH